MYGIVYICKRGAVWLHIIMFGDKDFTVYFGLVYNLTMAIIYLKSMMIIIDIQMFIVESNDLPLVNRQ